jgi:Uma2 family endonuclease
MQQYSFPSASRTILQDDGVYGPIPHQSVIARLTAGLYPFYRSGQIPYEPLPETMLLEEYAAPVPDVVLYDHEAEQVRVIIEVCKNTGFKHDTSKVIKLIDGELYGILEGFVYNYKTGQWLRYRKGDGGQATETAFSEVLNLDLGQFL